VTRTQESAPDDTQVIAAVPPVDDDGGDDRGEDWDDGRDDGLAAELAKAAPRRWWNRGTLVLGALTLVLGGFLGGVQVQKSYGTTAVSTGNRGTGFNGLNRGAGGYGGFTPGGAAPTAAPTAAAGTTGTVKLVDHGTIYLQTADGTLVTIKTSGKTTVRTAAKGALKDVKAGDTVTVQGSTAADGTVTATAVTADHK